MKLDVWHISGNGFHFGRRGLEQEESGLHIPSDTLFAALVARLAEQTGKEELDSFIAPFKNNGQAPFVLSSAFPRAGQVRFFPTPLRFSSRHSDKIKPKDIKRIQFVSEEIFRSLLNGANLIDLIESGILLQNRTLLVSASENDHLPRAIRNGDEPVWKIGKRPRVTLERGVPKSNIYFTGQTVYHPEGGLWFAIRWLLDDAQLKTRVANLLEDLGDAGIGGERSSGFGACRIEQAGILDLPDSTGTPWVSLSRYLPRKDETNALSAPEAAFKLETIGGWIYSPTKKGERRRTIHLLSEGSVLGAVSNRIPGQVVDLQPDYEGKRPLGHDVWRNGMALAIGLNWPEYGG
jgi:CRISPR-associated protein Csm4